MALMETTVSRDAIDKRSELIRSRLEGIAPDFPTALGMLGLAVVQLRELGVAESTIREAVETWLAQRKDVPMLKPPMWKPDATHIKRVMADFIRKR